MKFTRGIEINLPVQKVVVLFMDKNNLKQWKPGVIAYEHISGTPGEVGAVTKIIYARSSILETIVSKKLPSEIVVACEHQRTKFVHTVTNHFTRLEENKTLFEMTLTITKYAGLFSRIMILILSLDGSSKRYYQSLLNRFKAFAENIPLL